MYNDFTLKECRIPVCMSVVAYYYGRFKYTCTRVNILRENQIIFCIYLNSSTRTQLIVSGILQNVVLCIYIIITIYLWLNSHV